MWQRILLSLSTDRLADNCVHTTMPCTTEWGTNPSVIGIYLNSFMNLLVFPLSETLFQSFEIRNSETRCIRMIVYWNMIQMK